MAVVVVVVASVAAASEAFVGVIVRFLIDADTVRHLEVYIVDRVLVFIIFFVVLPIQLFFFLFLFSSIFRILNWNSFWLL